MPTIDELYRITGLNQAELARRARLTPNTVRKAENGEEVSSASARAIAEVFSEALGRKVLVGDISGLKVGR